MEMEDKRQDRPTDMQYCYILLDSIENSDDAQDQKKNVDTFKRKLNKILKPTARGKATEAWKLFDTKLLDGSFIATRRQLPPNKEVPVVNINGETLLYRALSKYKGVTKMRKIRNQEPLWPPRTEEHTLMDGMSKTNTSTMEEFVDKESAWKIIIDYMIENVPEMITHPKNSNDECKGYSPFYMAIVKKHTDLLPTMITKIKEPKPNDCDKVPSVEGSILEGNSVMLAGTPLGVAALTMDKRIFGIIQGLYDRLDDIQTLSENVKKDNIIHSMIKYFTKHQDKIAEGIEMLSYILDADSWVKPNQADDAIKKLLIAKNMEHLTPLQLAAKLRQFEFFEKILLNKSYCESTSDDGLTTQEVYDITELETIPVEETPTSSEDEHFQKVKHFSVLEFVYLQQMQIAFRFASCRPVYMIIKEKWSKYQYCFYSWFFMHFVFMSLLTWAAIERSSLQFQKDSSSGKNTLRITNPVRDDPKSLGLSITGLVVGVVFIFVHSVRRYVYYWCCFTRFGARIKANFIRNMWRMVSSLPYTNIMFEIFFVLFALLLILDFHLAFFVNAYENQCLVFALIIGWYLVLFFLQVFRRFSFFTVLIQRVMKDLLNFAIVMGFLLIGFTVAMFVVMQGADTTNDDFTSLPKALLKMFTVMLGIGELSDLFCARNPGLAIFVFVLFVLLTTILLLNALIAMMSNSCTELMASDYGIIKANKMHETLQKLSVIIFLESFLLKCFCVLAGEESRTTKNRRIIVVQMNQTVSNDEETNHGNFVSQAFQTMSNILTKNGQKKHRKKKRRINVVDDGNMGDRTARLDISSWEENIN